MTKSTLAYLDTAFSGMVPCKLIAFERETAWPDGGRLYARVQYTATRGGYDRGVTDSWPSRMVIPRDKVKLRRNGRHLVLAYDWADYGMDIPA